MANENESQNPEQRPAESEARRKRPPIVVVMGHVDHGKTTLLDYIRKTNLAAKEAGGITQAVGAYEILHHSTGQASCKITFIDTPGHEAFSKMRSRGAEVADLAILVVAADEGVKPQTKEAVDILNQSKTPFIVAINKIDKTGGNIEKAKNDLASAGVYLEGQGGQVSFHGVSAKTGEGMNELLDLVLLATDVENLTYDPKAPASGYVLEVRRDPQRGVEAAVILENGILRHSSEIHTKTASGKIIILENFLGQAIEKLEPSAPALVIGFEKLPQVGEIFSAAPVEKVTVTKPVNIRPTAPLPGVKNKKPRLNLVLKASDAGSLEAFSAVIKALEKDDAALHVVHESIGDITDGDVKSAIATGAAIIGFKNKADKVARNLAQAHEIKIITSDVIYDLVKTVEEFLTTLGKPKAIGELEVLAVFSQDKPEKQLVGGRVTSGVVRNKAAVEIVRAVDGQEKAEGSGKIISLREKKTVVSQAEEGKEAGLLINSPVLIRVGDRLIVRK